jgi:60 kDa SS-A/Ro ribonucleoprotein
LFVAKFVPQKEPTSIMPTAYAKHYKPNQTPQSDPMREDQVENSAGGFAWAIDEWMRLDRFLILGTEGGTYYASEQKLARENAKTIVGLIKKDGPRVVSRLTEISDAGRAYKNDAALFVLALCFAEGDAATKAAARVALPKVARIGTHLFTFLDYVQSMRGWGRGLKGAIGEWYESQTADALAYQLEKYKERNGWSHRDALRLSHPKTKDAAKNWLYKFAVGKVTDFSDAPAFVAACESVKTANAKDAADYVRRYNLPREVLPTEVLTDPGVWEALLEKMPMTAMIRNLATMTRVGAIKPMAKWTGEVNARLTDKERLTKGRIHPIQLLAALITYAAGKGARGTNVWTPVQSISDALDKAFYLAFDAVVPTAKRIMLAVDVSGSMGSGTICGVPGLTPLHGAAAMALTIANTETNYALFGFGTRFEPLRISPRQRLDDAMRSLQLPFQGTDCALPMLHAIREKMEIDAFIVITDNETWAGQVHPAQALTMYRQKFGLQAKLIVVGMTASNFTIADPNDRGMLDVVGFSTDTPNVIADFIRE